MSAAVDPGPPPSIRRQRTYTVRDIARIRGTDRSSALRWLKRYAAKHLREKKTGWVISARAYAILEAAQSREALVNRIRQLEESLESMDRRVTAHANALSKLHAL